MSQRFATESEAVQELLRLRGENRRLREDARDRWRPGFPVLTGLTVHRCRHNDCAEQDRLDQEQHG